MRAIEKFLKGEIDGALMGRFNEELREEGKKDRKRERGYIQSYEYIIT